MAGKFDNVDLGTDKAMQRMIAKVKADRKAVIQECIDKCWETDQCNAAEILKLFMEEEDVH